METEGLYSVSNGTEGALHRNLVPSHQRCRPLPTDRHQCSGVKEEGEVSFSLKNLQVKSRQTVGMVRCWCSLCCYRDDAVDYSQRYYLRDEYVDEEASQYSLRPDDVRLGPLLRFMWLSYFMQILTTSTRPCSSLFTEQ